MVNGSLKMLETRAEQVSVRGAAYLIAVERVAHARRERGWV
jgi:glutamate dehydrogenase/leucine dehydrogenase